MLVTTLTAIFLIISLNTAQPNATITKRYGKCRICWFVICFDYIRMFNQKPKCHMLYTPGTTTAVRKRVVSQLGINGA